MDPDFRALLEEEDRHFGVHPSSRSQPSRPHGHEGNTSAPPRHDTHASSHHHHHHKFPHAGKSNPAPPKDSHDHGHSHGKGKGKGKPKPKPKPTSSTDDLVADMHHAQKAQREIAAAKKECQRNTDAVRKYREAKGDKGQDEAGDEKVQELLDWAEDHRESSRRDHRK